MSQTTGNTRAFIEEQQYSTFILENLHEGILPTKFYRNVTDFSSGEVLNIKSVGEVELQDVEENTPINYAPIETSSIQMRITDWKGDAWYVTDKLRQDGAQVETLMATRAANSTRAYQEDFETRVFEIANEGMTSGDANELNGFAHRLIGSGNNNTLDVKDLIKLKLAFDKANVPAGGRVLIVDPIVSASLADQIGLSQNVDANSDFMKAFTEGWSRDHDFVMKIHGFHIFTSNRLPEVKTETIGGVTVDDAKVCLAMCLADDQCTPIMYADRQPLLVESERNKDLGRDEFVSRRRYGLGIQRTDTLGAILVSSKHID